MYYGNERVIEINQLLKFADENPIKTVLDIGAFKSQYHVPLMEKGIYINGVDINPDPDPYIKINNYIVGDALSIELPQADLVICVSTIEHLGFLCLRGQNTDVLKEAMIRKCITQAEKYLYLSFPFGASGHAIGFDNITLGEVNKWKAVFGLEWDVRFEPWFNETPGKDETWKLVSEEEASKIELIKQGRQVCCVGILKGIRRGFIDTANLIDKII